jgi:hypothetical protein
MWAVGTAALLITAFYLTWLSSPKKDKHQQPSIHRPGTSPDQVAKVKPRPQVPIHRDIETKAVAVTPYTRHKESGTQKIVVVKRSVPSRMPMQEAPVQSVAVNKTPQHASDEADTSEAAAIRVTVSRTPQDSISYAKAAAWDTDTDGRSVKTEWTLVGGSDTQISRQKLAVSDTSGQPQSLTVALSGDSRKQNGEEL